jgi:rare lipoprotein A
LAAHPAAATPNARSLATAINSEAASTEVVSLSKPVNKTVRQAVPLVQKPATPATKPTSVPTTQGALIERFQMAALPPATTRAAKEAAPADRPIRATPISIRASEPVSAPAVRPADVQAFQKIGAPYQVNGTWYIPTHEPDYNETGTASWYGRDFHGKSTANGELFDMNIVTAAHPTLPIPSLVEVTNLTNGRSMVVRVNDRGPFVADRLIDLSARGAELLGYREQGSTQVRVRYIGPADPEPLVTTANLTAPGEEKKWSNPAPAPVQTATVTQVAMRKPARPVKPTSINTDTVVSGLYVQAGAFSRRANAERALTQVSDMGPAQIVETQTASGASLYRILIGPVESQTEANVLAETVSGLGVSGAHVMASRN